MRRLARARLGPWRVDWARQGLRIVALPAVGTVVTAGCNRVTSAPPRDRWTTASFGADGPGWAACPRDASPDRSGHCACEAGTVALLGACVDPRTGDLFCGPAARIGPDGCTFRACGNAEALDLSTGACVARPPSVEGTSIACDPGAVAVTEGGGPSCVMREATCPRGTTRAGDACARGLRCPPGTLPAAQTCRPVVVRRGVDIGSWASLALGVDGGAGSPELCRPLAQNPRVFAVRPGAPASIAIAIALSVPDQDLSRVHFGAYATRDAVPVAPAADEAVQAAVRTLVELLRGLGGEGSAAAVDIRVHCRVESGETRSNSESKVLRWPPGVVAGPAPARRGDLPSTGFGMFRRGNWAHPFL